MHRQRYRLRTPNGDIDGITGYYTESEAVNILNNLQNDLTGEPIELYMMLCYKGNLLLDISNHSTSNRYQMGDYELAANYDSNNNLLFYSAYRNHTNGIEYIIWPNGLVKFIKNYNFYKACANLFYLNGKPSLGQVQIAAGDYLDGLANMWGDALKSPEYYIYLGNILVASATNLQTVRWTNVTRRNAGEPSYRIDSHTFDQFRNAIRGKSGVDWQPLNGDPGKYTLINGNYRYISRPASTEWPGPTIDYFKNGKYIGKFRFTQ